MTEIVEPGPKQVRLRLKRPDGRVVEVVPSMVSAGMDFGFSDPFVIEVGAKIGSCWLNFYEVYHERLSIGEVLKVSVQTVRKFGIERVWADSEDPQMIQYLQSHGLPVVPNQIKNVEYGIQTVYSLMKQIVDHPVLGPGPKFRVDRAACPNLVREASRYGHAVVRGEVRTGKPVDKHNHAWDSVRYYVTGEGEIPPDLYSPEQKHRPGMYTKDGKWRDDPVGHQLALARRNQNEPGLWWDEKRGSVLDEPDWVGMEDDGW